MSEGEKDRFGDKLHEAERGRENEFFADRDRKLLEKLKAKAGVQEVEAVRELTHMRCPQCGERLVARSHLDVKREECPKHHGMWFDEGDLHKLVERESSGWLARILGRPR